LGILQPPDETVAELKLNLAYVQDVSAVRLCGSRERKDAAQESFRTLFLGDAGRNRPTAQGMVSE